MKKILFLLIPISIFFVACDSRSNSTDNTNQVVTSGSWRISLYTDSGNNETSNFSGYTFVFNSNGTLEAIKNNVTQNGTWSISSSSNKFNINLGPKDNTNKPLGDLTDNWKILSNSTTEIRLTDDNPASAEFVTFSKI